METRPEESVKNFLSLFLDDAEAERLADPNYVAQLVEEGELPWQVLAAVGVHVPYRRPLPDSDPEKAVLRDLVARTRAPIEALVKSLAAKVEEGPWDNEEARLLFHARFALGLVLRESGEVERAKRVLHEVASTKVSVRGGHETSWLRCTSDVSAVKWGTACFLTPQYLVAKDYQELAYLFIEAGACAPVSALDIEVLKEMPTWLDLSAEQEKETDSSREFHFPSLGWLNIFEAAAETLAAYGEADASGAIPNECAKQSAQFLAWEFGQLAGRFCTHERWRKSPFEGIYWYWDNLGDIVDSVEPAWGREQMSQALSAVISLVCDYDSVRDWESTREHYVTMWKSCYTSEGLPLLEITPDTDLFWAMRIGFADKILEVGATTKEEQALTISSERMSLEVLRSRHVLEERMLPLLEERLSPSRREIRDFVLQGMGPVGNRLPAKVVNALQKGERLYRTEEDDDGSKVCFCKAVEASLNHCFVSPLLSFMQKQHLMKLQLPFSQEQGAPRRLAPKQIERMNPAQWCDVLEMVIASLDNKGFSPLIAPDFKAFLNQHVGARIKELRPLFAVMREVWQCRGRSAHYEPSEARYEKERQELDRMRELVLGLGNSKSVIVQIFELLGTEGGK